MNCILGVLLGEDYLHISVEVISQLLMFTKQANKNKPFVIFEQVLKIIHKKTKVFGLVGPAIPETRTVLKI